jgi:hypothetical protein
VPPIRLTDDEFHNLLSGGDPFRLAILGVAAIEADIDAAISETFDGEVPDELAKARWGIKLALAVALGLLPASDRPLFDTLATIRNRFGHGEIHTFTRQHANQLFDAVRKSVITVKDERHVEVRAILRAAEPIVSLRFALDLARSLFGKSAAAAHERREEDRRAGRTQRKAREALLRRLAHDVKLSHISS